MDKLIEALQATGGTLNLATSPVETMMALQVFRGNALDSIQIRDETLDAAASKAVRWLNGELILDTGFKTL